MSDLLTSVGSFLSSNLGTISKGLGAAGTAANVYSGVSNAINQSGYNSTQSYIQNLVKNPTKLAAAANAYQQPLTAGLTDSVTNQVQGQLAERGLGGSPASMTSAITQALAPYVQQNQSTAMNTLLQSLGLGSGARPTQLPTVDMSKLLAQLKLGSTSSTDPYATLFNNASDQTLQTEIPDLGDLSVAA